MGRKGVESEDLVKWVFANSAGNNFRGGGGDEGWVDERERDEENVGMGMVEIGRAHV